MAFGAQVVWHEESLRAELSGDSCMQLEKIKRLGCSRGVQITHSRFSRCAPYLKDGKQSVKLKLVL